jgi:hypothetical protein
MGTKLDFNTAYHP